MKSEYYIFNEIGNRVKVKKWSLKNGGLVFELDNGEIINFGSEAKIERLGWHCENKLNDWYSVCKNG